MVWGRHQAQQNWQVMHKRTSTATRPTSSHLGEATMTAAVPVPKAVHGGVRECCELAASNCHVCDLTSTVQPPAWAAETVTYLISAVQLAEYGQGLSATQTSQKREFQWSGYEPSGKENQLSTKLLCLPLQHHCCHKSKELLHLSTVWLTLTVLLKE